MKVLYSLNVPREIEVEETYTKKKRGGGTVEAVRTVKRKEESKLVLKKPSMSELEDADFFYGQQFNKFIQAGYMTRAMLQKKFSDVGGIIGENEGVQKTLSDYLDATKIIEFYEGRENLPEDKKELLEKAKKDFAFAQQYLTDLQSGLNAQFNQTADVKAEQKLIEWFLINFLCLEDENEQGDKEYFPFFNGHSFDEKREDYLEIQEGEDSEDKEIIKKHQLLNKAFDEFVRVIAIWHSGLAKTEEELKAKVKELFGEPTD